MKTSERIRSISIDHKTSSIDPVARMRSPVFVLNDAAQIATQADALMVELKEALKMVVKANNENIDGGFLDRDEAVIIFAALKHYQEYVK